MKTALVPALSLLFCFALPAASNDFSKETIKTSTLAPGVYLLQGAGGNMTALMGPEGTLLVDDDYAEMSEKLEAALVEIKAVPVRFVVNTHFHYDHTGANALFGRTATIIAATETRERLMHEQTLWHEQHPPAPPLAWPVLTYDQTLALHLDGEEVRLVHLPSAHTDGDTIVYFKKSNIVATGDLYFSGMFPIFHPEHGGSLDGYLVAIKSILDEISDETKIVPGHGPLSNKAELEQYYRMILASVATVKKGIRAKNSLEQIQKAGLPPEWVAFSHGYSTTERWLKLVYESLIASTTRRI